MGRKEYHVVPRDGCWAVVRDKAERASALFDTKSEAVSAARVYCRNQGAELVIHDQKGKIVNSNSYGNDPCPPRDMVH